MTTPTYPTGPAALFHAVAVAEDSKKKKETIWAYCPICWTRTEQVFEAEDKRFEHYRCTLCGIPHSIAVR